MTPLTPAAVTALAQQAAESPAHLDPVLVQQVCQEWQIGQQAAALQRCIVEAAYQDKVKAEQQRDAALAERDALQQFSDYLRLRYEGIVDPADSLMARQREQAALAEACLVLREVEWSNGDFCPICAGLHPKGHRGGCALAAVLAQEEPR